jgi:hypothetical protein
MAAVYRIFMGKITKKNERLLAELFYVAASNIQGKGVFARVDIPKGSFMGEYQGVVVPQGFDSYYTFGYTRPSGRNVTIDGRNILRHLNHQGRWPNGEFDGLKFYAIRNIKKGDEVTFHYNRTMAEIRGDGPCPA